MKYHCEFPFCTFETDHSSQINEHHIVPKEAGGSNAKFNRIFLCATHHNGFIYCKESTSGTHSIRNPDSIELIGWRLSSEGKILEYIDSHGELKFFKREV